MSGGEDCESRSLVTVSVSGHSRGSEARSPKTARGRLRGRLLLRCRLRPAVGGATPPQRTAGLSRSDQGNKLGAPRFSKRGLYLVPLKVAPGSLRVYIVVNV
jgi:hypothetical protein